MSKTATEWAPHRFASAPPSAMPRRAPSRDEAPRSFSPEAPVTWRNADGFVREGVGFAPASGFTAPSPRDRAAAGEGFVPSARFAGFGRAEPADIVAETVEPEVEAEEVVAEAAPAIDPELFSAAYAEGERAAYASLRSEAEACARLMAGLTSTTRFDRSGLSQRLQQTVLFLVRQLVGEIGISPERLAARVEDAINLLADVTEPARIHLHPEDLALLADHLPAHVATIGNAQIERGGFRLETFSATIEDAPSLWMEQLAAALDKLPV